MSFAAIVLAGGRGARLRPVTHVLPKPLLPVGERPILDLVLSGLAEQGCGQVTIAVGYLGHLIEAYCGTGERWSLDVRYQREDEPLGTAGALATVEVPPGRPFVVMNGDVLSDLAFHDLLATHERVGAELTIGSHQRTVRDELGIIEADDAGRVVAYHEKPEHTYLVSMGIYVLSPSVLDVLRPGERLDFPDLVTALLDQNRLVATHVHEGYWLDVGRPDDFERANELFSEDNR